MVDEREDLDSPEPPLRDPDQTGLFIALGVVVVGMIAACGVIAFMAISGRL